MADTGLKLRVNTTPTIFNKDTLLGGLIGSFFTPVGTVVGAVIGSYMGKKRMEDELANGKSVNTPSMLNKDTAIGGMLGLLVGSAAAVATFFATHVGIFTEVMSSISKGTLSVSPGLGIAAAVLPGAIMLGTAAVGAYMGGKSGYNKMQGEMNQAIGQEIAQQSAVRSQSKLIEMAESLDPQIADGKNFTQRLLEEKLAQGPRTVG